MELLCLLDRYSPGLVEVFLLEADGGLALITKLFPLVAALLKKHSWESQSTSDAIIALARTCAKDLGFEVGCHYQQCKRLVHGLFAVLDNIPTHKSSTSRPPFFL